MRSGGANPLRNEPAGPEGDNGRALGPVRAPLDGRYLLFCANRPVPRSEPEVKSTP